MVDYIYPTGTLPVCPAFSVMFICTYDKWIRDQIDTTLGQSTASYVDVVGVPHTLAKLAKLAIAIVSFTLATIPWTT